ncbi:MAG: 50S ribosomal protein L13 [Methanomassiliicoccales archaeon]|nr:MAG: 50S ribosomal protein L13 [Methanomassiliicoccales archaeon]
MVVIDAENLIMGRLASNVAKLLLNGSEVIIVNAEKAIISGSKKRIIEDYYQKRNVGTARKGPYYPRMPDRILKRTIRGMMPYKKPSGKEALKRLKVYIGIPKDLQDEPLSTIKGASATGKIKFIQLGEVSRGLGAKF